MFVCLCVCRRFTQHSVHSSGCILVLTSPLSLSLYLCYFVVFMFGMWRCELRSLAYISLLLVCFDWFIGIYLTSSCIQSIRGIDVCQYRQRRCFICGCQKRKAELVAQLELNHTLFRQDVCWMAFVLSSGLVDDDVMFLLVLVRRSMADCCFVIVAGRIRLTSTTHHIK